MSQGQLQHTVNHYREQLLANEARAEQALNAAHKHTLAAIQPRLDKLYREIAAKQKDGETVPPSWLYEEHRLEATKRMIENQINHYAALAQMVAGQMQHRGAQLGQQSAQAQLQGTVPPGVQWTFGVPSPAAMLDIIGATQAGSPLADLFNGFGAEAADAAGQALITGLSLGQNPRQIAAQIEQALGVSRNRALVISRNEMLRCYKSSNLENYRANSDVVEQWRWTAAKSLRTCGMCLAMDGTLHDMSEDLDSHVCCRCTPAPVTKSWADILGPLGIDTSGLHDASQDDYQSGSDWFDAQDESAQKAILGGAKFAAWKDNQFTLADLVGVAHDRDWGTSRYEKPLKELIK